jgi:hypothetical protein
MDCKLCGTRLESSTTWSQHVNGKKHIAAAARAGPDYVQPQWPGERASPTPAVQPAATATLPKPKTMAVESAPPLPAPRSAAVVAPRSAQAAAAAAAGGGFGSRQSSTSYATDLPPATTPTDVRALESTLRAVIGKRDTPEVPAVVAAVNPMRVLEPFRKSDSGKEGEYTCKWEVPRPCWLQLRPKSTVVPNTRAAFLKEAYDALTHSLSFDPELDGPVASVKASGPYDPMRSFESLLECVVAFHQDDTTDQHSGANVSSAQRLPVGGSHGGAATW